MPDYIYLLENRLSADQQHALRQLREAAREAGMILFLSGDAVRELTSGHAVRSLEVAVHGNALKLKKTIENLGGSIWGESEATHTLYVCFPGTVRVDVVSTHRMDYSHIEKPVYLPASIQEDLRRRDFTVNAMAISLNEGSFGLLMDPLNGAADIESRTLRLVSNYGFVEDPSLLIRATRYKARLGWEMDPKTSTRYENAKGDGAIDRLPPHAQSRELEQIGHEDEAIKILRALDEEGWMKYLFPAWTPAKADDEKLKELHSLAVELLLQGVHADTSAAQMQLLTAKMNAKDLAALKNRMLRPGFVEEWNSLDAIAAKFAKILLSKDYSTASAGYKLLTTYDPEAVLWLAFTSKDKNVQARFQQFLKVWPEARQRIPHALMQEMRITPDLATYSEIVQSIFLQLIDENLATPEEMRAFLEPHSPPAPPPQVTIKRPRAKRGEAKVKERTYDDDEDGAEDGLDDDDEDLDDLGGDDDDIDLGISIPKIDIEPEIEPEGVDDDLDAEEESADDHDEPASAKRAAKGAKPAEVKKEAPRAAAPPSPPAPPPEAKAEPAATPAKPATSAAQSAAPEPESRKGDKMSKKVAAAAAPNVTVSAPGAKPPQAKAQAFTSNVESALHPGAKPPQVGTPTPLSAMIAKVPGVKPPQVGKPTPITAKVFTKPGAKPPQASKPPLTSRAVAAPAAKAPNGNAPVKVAAKAPAKKAAPAKGKTAAKPAPKPVKKAAPAKAAKPTPKPVKKKR